MEPTRVVERTGRRWDPDELEAAFAGAAAATTSRSSCGPSTTTAEPTRRACPTNWEDIRNGGFSKGLGRRATSPRSGLFHHVVGELKKRRWTVEQIHALLEKYPNGVAAKYRGRLADEIRRSYDKVENGNGAGNGASNGVGGPHRAQERRRRLRQGPRPSGGSGGNPGGSGAAHPPPPPPAPGAPSGPAPGPAPGTGPAPGMCCPPSGSSPDSCRA